jgi:outer membrane protein OmpA-like peptidoglycan-associated protein
MDTGFTVGHRYTTRQITFDNHWNYLPGSKTTIDSIYNFLNKNKTLTVELGVHVDKADSKSSEPITQKRAQAIVDTLMKMGIDKNRLSPKGYGAMQRIFTEANVKPAVKSKEEARMIYDLNNRVELRITSANFDQE